MVEVRGVAVSIAETGEQLGWLGAALRSSSRQIGLVYCKPTITNIIQKRPDIDVAYEMSFTEIPQPRSTTNGQCWHDIFRNPVVVRGYPIPKRTQSRTGLDISLNIMAGLAQTQRVDRFDSRVYIKGFSTMLVPTRLEGNFLYWHLVYNKEGSRISYLDGVLEQEQRIVHMDLKDFRHVLGWCSEARFYAGKINLSRTFSNTLLLIAIVC